MTTRKFCARAAGWLIAAWLAMALVPVRAQMVTEVIPLDYRTAQEMVELLRPLVPAPGVVSGISGNLVVRTTRANLDDVLTVLERLDRPPRQLLISVRHGLDRAGQAAGSGAYIESDGNVRYRVGRPGSAGGGTVQLDDGTTRGRATVYSTRSRSQSSDVQQIRVLEGGEAYIATGQAVPIQERTLILGRRGRETVVDTTRYEDVTSGFSVRPRLSGDGSQVTLEITPRRQNLRANDGRGAGPVVDSQSASTTVRVPTGVWTELGGASRAARRSAQGTLRSTHARRHTDYSVTLKVDVLP